MRSEYFNEEYIVVDLETTGMSPYQGCEIIEIGVTEIKKSEIKLNYSRLIKPKGIIPTQISQLTNITNEMVENEKTIEEVLPKFREYIGDKVLIAHNAKFDIVFLNFYLSKLNLPLVENYICTLEMLKKNKNYTQKRKSLSVVCEYYRIENLNAHRAYADTFATAKLFLKIREEI